MSDSVPVILDTDIGTDVDDAVALAYLLRHPRCQLLGITTVTGDVAKRATCAEAVCKAAGRNDVPIHCGASDVLLLGPGQPDVPHYPVIEQYVPRREWPESSAIDFLRRTIRQRPGEITLLTIGPLTNIALLFAVAPDIPPMLKQVVSMAGVFFDADPTRREWNAQVDPIATAMVYKAGVPAHFSIGLDVTLQCQMDAGEVRQRFRPAPLDVVSRMADVWFTRAPKLTFHDPLAAACIFRPDLCTYAGGRVTVSIEADESRSGRTLFSTSHGVVPHHVARSVDARAFFEEYFSAFR